MNHPENPKQPRRRWLWPFRRKQRAAPPDIQRLVEQIADAELQARLVARTAFPYEEYREILDRAYRLRSFRSAVLLIAILLPFLVTAALAAYCTLYFDALSDLRNAMGDTSWVLSAWNWLAIAVLACTCLLMTLVSISWGFGAFSRLYAHYRRITQLDRAARNGLRHIPHEARVDAEREIRRRLATGLNDDTMDQDALAALVSLDALCEQVRSRLREAIAAQERSARFMLTLGLISAFVGISAIAAMGVQGYLNPETDELGASFWAHMSGKIAPAIALQGVWVFFFWSYRRAEAEAKFFQNELSSMESKIMSIRLASESLLLQANYEGGSVRMTDQQLKIVSTLLVGLLHNERHLILKRGEHTTYSHQIREDRRGIGRIFRQQFGGAQATS